VAATTALKAAHADTPSSPAAAAENTTAANSPGSSERSEPASADSSARARALFLAGADAYDRGRYKDAVDAFLAADRIAPRPELSFNVARAYERLGDDAAALGWYRDYVRRAPSASDRSDVDERIARLQDRLSLKGVQQITVLSIPERATVVLDGKPVGVTPWTGEIAPGKHSVALRLVGYLEARNDVVLPRNQAIDVSVSLSPAPFEPPPPTDGRPVVAPSSSSPPPLRTQPTTESRSIGTLTWVSLGVGVAAFGGAVAFELSRSRAEEDARSASTQLAAQDAYDRMESRQTAARALAATGAAAVLLGGVLVYLDLAEPADDSPRIGLGCAGGACAVVGGAKF